MVDNRSDSGAEPSMEEILSSIKRIIAEEEGGPAAGPRRRPTDFGRDSRGADAPRPRDEEDVLDLDQPLASALPPPAPGFGHGAWPRPAIGGAGDETPAAQARVEAPTPIVPQPRAEPIPQAAAEPPSPRAPVTQAPPSPFAEPAAANAIPAPVPAPEPSRPAPEPILSAGAADATRGSLQSLSRMIVRPDAPAAGDNTLEGLVREMLKPMLRDWLDANLPALAEKLVAREIERISGQAR